MRQTARLSRCQAACFSPVPFHNRERGELDGKFGEKATVTKHGFETVDFRREAGRPREQAL